MIFKCNKSYLPLDNKDNDYIRYIIPLIMALMYIIQCTRDYPGMNNAVMYMGARHCMGYVFKSKILKCLKRKIFMQCIFEIF